MGRRGGGRLKLPLVVFDHLNIRAGVVQDIWASRFKGRTVLDVSKAVSSPKEPAVISLQIKSIAFPECSIDYQDYTPCTNPPVFERGEEVWFSSAYFLRTQSSSV